MGRPWVSTSSSSRQIVLELQLYCSTSFLILTSSQKRLPCECQEFLRRFLFVPLPRGGRQLPRRNWRSSVCWRHSLNHNSLFSTGTETRAVSVSTCLPIVTSPALRRFCSQPFFVQFEGLLILIVEIVQIRLLLVGVSIAIIGDSACHRSA